MQLLREVWGNCMKIRALGALVACCLTGCGTVTRGTTESVSITSEPADATIRTSLGHSCPQSPCTVEVSRKTKFTAFAEKEGFKPGSIYVDTRVAGAGAAGVAGNVIIGGVVGIGVDVATGAALDHYPNPAHIRLAPVASPEDSTTAVVPEKNPKPGKNGVPTS